MEIHCPRSRNGTKRIASHLPNAVAAGGGGGRGFVVGRKGQESHGVPIPKVTFFRARGERRTQKGDGIQGRPPPEKTLRSHFSNPPWHVPGVLPWPTHPSVTAQALAGLQHHQRSQPPGESAMFLSTLSSFLSLKINLKAVKEEVPFDNTNDSDRSKADAKWRHTNHG